MATDICGRNNIEFYIKKIFKDYMYCSLNLMISLGYEGYYNMVIILYSTYFNYKRYYAMCIIAV